MYKRQEIWLEKAPPRGYHVEVTYTYGDTNNASLAKLATIFLTKLGLKLMKMNGGVFPSEDIRIGDLQYRLSHDREAVSLIMDVRSILNAISRPKVGIIDERAWIIDEHRGWI